MRTRVLLLIGFLVTPAVAQADDRAADREAIRKHIDGIFNAYIRKDRDTVRATHAPEWRGFLSQSRNIIRGIDEYMAEADGILKNPNFGMTGYRMVDYDITFHGDIAIINYVAETELKQGDKSSQGKLRVLDIYEKRNGDWMQIASNVAMHPDIVWQQIENARKAPKP